MDIRSGSDDGGGGSGPPLFHPADLPDSVFSFHDFHEPNPAAFPGWSPFPSASGIDMLSSPPPSVAKPPSRQSGSASIFGLSSAGNNNNNDNNNSTVTANSPGNDHPSSLSAGLDGLGVGLGMGIGLPGDLDSPLTAAILKTGAGGHHNPGHGHGRGPSGSVAGSGSVISSGMNKSPPHTADPKERRRTLHNAVERRRRDLINRRIQELAQLLPDEYTWMVTNTLDFADGAHPGRADNGAGFGFGQGPGGSGGSSGGGGGAGSGSGGGGVGGASSAAAANHRRRRSNLSARRSVDLVDGFMGGMAADAFLAGPPGSGSAGPGGPDREPHKGQILTGAVTFLKQLLFMLSIMYERQNQIRAALERRAGTSTGTSSTVNNSAATGGNGNNPGGISGMRIKVEPGVGVGVGGGGGGSGGVPIDDTIRALVYPASDFERQMEAVVQEAIDKFAALNPNGTHWMVSRAQMPGVGGVGGGGLGGVQSSPLGFGPGMPPMGMGMGVGIGPPGMSAIPLSIMTSMSVPQAQPQPQSHAHAHAHGHHMVLSPGTPSSPSPFSAHGLSGRTNASISSSASSAPTTTRRFSAHAGAQAARSAGSGRSVWSGIGTDFPARPAVDFAPPAGGGVMMMGGGYYPDSVGSGRPGPGSGSGSGSGTGTGTNSGSGGGASGGGGGSGTGTANTPSLASLGSPHLGFGGMYSGTLMLDSPVLSPFASTGGGDDGVSVSGESTAGGGSGGIGHGLEHWASPPPPPAFILSQSWPNNGSGGGGGGSGSGSAAAGPFGAGFVDGYFPTSPAAMMMHAMSIRDEIDVGAGGGGGGGGVGGAGERAGRDGAKRNGAFGIGLGLGLGRSGKSRSRSNLGDPKAGPNWLA